MKTPLPRLLLLAGLLVVSASAAFQAGSVAYTKKLETTLLAEPKPLAEATGKPQPAPVDPHREMARSLVALLGGQDPAPVFAAAGLPAPTGPVGEAQWSASLTRAEREHRLAALLRAAAAHADRRPVDALGGRDHLAR